MSDNNNYNYDNYDEDSSSEMDSLKDEDINYNNTTTTTTTNNNVMSRGGSWWDIIKETVKPSNVDLAVETMLSPPPNNNNNNNIHIHDENQDITNNNIIDEKNEQQITNDEEEKQLIVEDQINDSSSNNNNNNNNNNNEDLPPSYEDEFHSPSNDDNLPQYEHIEYVDNNQNIVETDHKAAAEEEEEMKEDINKEEDMKEDITKEEEVVETDNITHANTEEIDIAHVEEVQIAQVNEEPLVETIEVVHVEDEENKKDQSLSNANDPDVNMFQATNTMNIVNELDKVDKSLSSMNESNKQINEDNSIQSMKEDYIEYQSPPPIVDGVEKQEEDMSMSNKNNEEDVANKNNEEEAVLNNDNILSTPPDYLRMKAVSVEDYENKDQSNVSIDVKQDVDDKSSSDGDSSSSDDDDDQKSVTSSSSTSSEDEELKRLLENAKQANMEPNELKEDNIEAKESIHDTNADIFEQFQDFGLLPEPDIDINNNNNNNNNNNKILSHESSPKKSITISEKEDEVIMNDYNNTIHEQNLNQIENQKQVMNELDDNQKIYAMNNDESVREIIELREQIRVLQQDESMYKESMNKMKEDLSTFEEIKERVTSNEKEIRNLNREKEIISKERDNYMKNVLSLQKLLSDSQKQVERYKMLQNETAITHENRQLRRIFGNFNQAYISQSITNLAEEITSEAISDTQYRDKLRTSKLLEKLELMSQERNDLLEIIDNLRKELCDEIGKTHMLNLELNIAKNDNKCLREDLKEVEDLLEYQWSDMENALERLEFDLRKQHNNEMDLLEEEWFARENELLADINGLKQQLEETELDACTTLPILINKNNNNNNNNNDDVSSVNIQNDDYVLTTQLKLALQYAREDMNRAANYVQVFEYVDESTATAMIRELEEELEEEMGKTTVLTIQLKEYKIKYEDIRSELIDTVHQMQEYFSHQIKTRDDKIDLMQLYYDMDTQTIAEHYECQIISMESMITELRDEIKFLKFNSDYTTREYEDLMIEMDELKSSHQLKLEIVELDKKMIQYDNDDLQSSLKTLKKSIRKIVHKFYKKTGQFRLDLLNVRSHIMTLRNFVVENATNVVEETSRLWQQLTEKLLQDEQINNVQTQLKLRSSVESLTSTVQEQLETLASVSQEATDWAEKYEQTVESVETMNKQLVDMAFTVEQLGDRNENLTYELHAQKSYNTELLYELQLQQKSETSMVSELDEKKRYLKELSFLVTVLEEKLATAEANVQRLEANKTSLEADTKAAKRESDESNVRMELLKADIAYKERLIKELEKEVTTQRQLSSDKDAQLKAMNWKPTKMKKDKKEMKKLTVLLNEQQKTLQTLEKNLKETNDRNKKLLEENQNYSVNQLQLKKALEQAERVRDELLKEKSTINKHLGHLNKKIPIDAK